MARRRTAALAALVTLASAAAVAATAGPATARPMRYDDLTRMQHRLLSGAADYALRPASGGGDQASPAVAPQGGDTDRNADADPSSAPGSFRTGGATNYTPTSASGCAATIRREVKVDQTCLTLTDPDLQGRGQAQNETSIAVDPNDESRQVGSANDYRRGDGNCYASYSRDGGRTWTDSTPPTSFVRGTAFGSRRQYFQGGGDTSVAFDTRGNAYLSCQMFNRGTPVSSNPDLSSGLYVLRSTGNGGASWNFPARPVAESADLTGSGEAPFEDKQLMTVDASTTSPYRDRVYVTWTEFASDGSAFIYESYSDDYAEHFSPRVLVSRTSSLCPVQFGKGTGSNACDANQDSQPFTAPDGTLYVTFANFNNTQSGNDNRNQMLLSRSTDGGRTFSPLVKVGDYYDLPDCATYQDGKDPGRACVPEKASSSNSYFRASNYPVGAVGAGGAVTVTYGSYLNPHSREANGCAPTGLNPDTGINTYDGVKTPGACNNDILASVSTDGGRSFDMAGVDPRAQRSLSPAGATDQFWQWYAVTGTGTGVLSTYDRQYADDETTGASDVTVVAQTSRGLDSTRATSSPMPPPTQFSGTFYGDYSGLAADRRAAYPLWSDTRNADLFLCPGTGAPGHPPATCTGSASNAPQANDQEIYTTRVDVRR